MTRTYNSPERGSEYRLHRDGAAVDSTDSDEQAHGMNMHGFRFANIQVVPNTGANPTTEVMFWSEAAEKFIKANTAIIKAGLGANIPYEYSVEANGRIIWVKVTVGAAKVYVSGWDNEYR